MPTLKELRELAKDNGLKNYSKLKKDELVALLKKSHINVSEDASGKKESGKKASSKKAPAKKVSASPKKVSKKVSSSPKKKVSKKAVKESPKTSPKKKVTKKVVDKSPQKSTPNCEVITKRQLDFMYELVQDRCMRKKVTGGKKIDDVIDAIMDYFETYPLEKKVKK